jgi:hypothetical protein
MSEFFNWEMLGTYAGCTATVGVITQFVKGVGVLNRIPTQIVTYVLALVLMLLASVFTGGVTVEGAVLTVFNAVVVSLASNGGYSAVERIGEKMKQEDVQNETRD